MRDVGHVKSKHETQRDQFDQGVAVDDNLLEFPVTRCTLQVTLDSQKKKNRSRRRKENRQTHTTHRLTLEEMKLCILCSIPLTGKIDNIEIIRLSSHTSVSLYTFTFRSLETPKSSPSLRGSQDVAVERGQNTEEKQIEQQFSVNELVERAAPHKQEPGESTAGGTGDLVLIRDRHLSSVHEHRASFFSRTTRPRARCYSYFQKFSSVEPERESVTAIVNRISIFVIFYVARSRVLSATASLQVYLF